LTDLPEYSIEKKVVEIGQKVKVRLRRSIQNEYIEENDYNKGVGQRATGQVI